MERRLIINENDRNHILSLYQLNTKKIISEDLQIKPGMKATGILQDNAQGRNMIIKSVNYLKDCGVYEVEFTGTKDKPTGRSLYGYFKYSELPSLSISKNEIDFKRDGEGVKSQNPCTDYATMDNWGLLKIEAVQTPEQQQNEKAMYDMAKQWIINNKINLNDTPQNIINDINTFAMQKDEDGNPTFNQNLIPYIKKSIEDQSGGKISFAGVTPTNSKDNLNTTTTTTVAPAQPTVIQKGVKNPKVEALQNKLNEKFKSGLTPDGKWGPKTAAAVQTALASLQGSQQPNTSTQPLQKPTTDYAKQFQQNAQNIINQNPFKRTN